MSLNKNVEQVKAIKTINENVVVNAGAGTGKTKVLTDRYIEILENGNLPKGREVESIVAITFTNKATQEMIERIRSLIESKTDEDDKWIRYFRDLEKANISTIHGFCGDILRENPIEAGIDPYFEILDDVKGGRILYSTSYRVVNEYLNNNDIFIDFLKNQKLDRIDSLSSDFVSLYNAIRTYSVTFDKIRKDTNNLLDSLEYSHLDIERIKEITLELIEKFTKRSKLVKFSETKEFNDFINNTMDKDIYYYLEEIVNNLGTSKKELELQNELIERINKVMLSKELEYKWMYNLIIDIIERIDIEYTEEKRINGYLDYDDLQILVLKLLNNEEVLMKYQNKYKYFMIDEFQDTNELQKQIFYKLTSVNKPLDRNNLFVVGDPKQSIYRFRGADVNIFYDVMEDIKSNYNEKNIITLKTNYRSVNNVMEYVNNIFSRLMGVKYDRLEAFNNSKDDIDIEIILDEELVVGEDENYISDLDYESEILAKRIVKYIEDGYKYSDVAILFRSMTRVQEYENKLKEFGIPFYNSSNKSFYKNQEIIDIITMLKFISNPLDTLCFIGILRSNMFGINDDLVFKIINEKKHMGNIEKIEVLVEQDNTLTSKDIALLEYASKKLNYFLEVKKHVNIVELVDIIIQGTYFIESSILKDDGEQKAANIYKFTDLTKSYHKEYKGSLEEYIDYIESIRDKDESDEIIISGNDNVVKIMTIHASKGLQFPIVFLPNMASRQVSRYNRFIFNDELGLNINNNITNGKYDQAKEVEKDKELEELKRVYYVAMTRAEEKLVLGFQGYNSGIKKEIMSSYDLSGSKIIKDIDYNKEEQINLETINYFKNIKNQNQYNFDLLYNIDKEDYISNVVFSITQFMIFNTCQRKYFLDYIWRVNIDIVEEEEIEQPIYNQGDDEYIIKSYNILPGAKKGNIVHDFCNIYSRDDDVKEKINESINKHVNKDHEKVFEIVKPYIDNYLKLYDESVEEIYSEKEFYLKLENGYLYGIIDRININDNGIDVIDFKTNIVPKDKNEKEELNNYYKPQLLTYAYVCKKLFNKEINSTGIWYLYNNEKIEFNITDDELDSAINEIQEFINFVSGNDNIFSYKTNKDNCKNCNHNKFCERIT